MYAKLVLTVVASLLVTSFATAQSNISQDRTTKMERHFSYTDTNGDGFIGRDEAAHYPALIRHFSVIDFSKDGKLSREEMQAYRLGTHGKQRAASVSPKSKAAESDSDGALTKADADDAHSAPRKNF
jgi:Ca2+-binding EF-hand superfamily protein